MLPRWHSGKRSPCQCRRCKRCGFNSWVGKMLWRRQWQPTSVFLPGKFIDRGAWQATVCGMAKSCTWLSNWTYTHTHTICYIVYLLNVSISMITVFFSGFPLLHDSCFYFMNHNTDFISLKFLNTYLKVLLSTSLTFIGRSLVNFFFKVLKSTNPSYSNTVDITILLVLIALIYIYFYQK